MKKLILLLRQLFCHHKYQYTEINHDGLNTMECKWCGKRKIAKVFPLLALVFVMCGCKESILTNHKDTHVDYIKDGFPITIIDSCEYIRYANGYGPEYTHKGNCKFCAERRKKEQEELIRKINSL